MWVIDVRLYGISWESHIRMFQNRDQVSRLNKNRCLLVIFFSYTSSSILDFRILTPVHDQPVLSGGDPGLFNTNVIRILVSKHTTASISKKGFLYSILHPQQPPPSLKSYTSWWFSPTHSKNMLVKLDHFPRKSG